MDIIASISGYIASDIRMATPLLLAGLGLLLMNRAGLRFIGCEGVMLIATLAAVIGSYYTGSVWMGLLYAMVAGAVMGSFYAFLTVSLRSNQTVISTAFNLLGTGLTATIYRMVFGTMTNTPSIDTFEVAKIPVLGDIPYLGEAFFNHMILVYVAFLLVPVISWFVFHTPSGLNLRSVGENPRAADTLGIDVYRVRYLASIAGCILISMGGAFLSTGSLRFFAENMTAGRGYIAVAAVVFGKYTPIGVLLATLLFGAGNVVANLLQTGANVSYFLPVMIPYILTIVALAGFTGKTIPPASLGKPYKKG